MEGDFIKIDKKLLPLSWLYGLGVGFRNLLFEMNILKSRSFSIPVISVGNITVGGTGKTPHVEYLIRLLKKDLHVAVLSRGYKRKTKGFLLATKDTPMQDIGDEPYQMKQKFKEIDVAVDSKRTRGIDNITSGAYTDKAADVILLDDAFQHRYVKPGLSILLVDYHRQVIYDRLLPAGRLREPVRCKDRADIVIVTKCPKTLTPMEFRVLTKQMDLFPYQQLYFTTLDYDDLRPLFPKEANVNVDNLESLKGKNVFLLTGIASPTQLIVDLEPFAESIHPLSFSDHHNFKKKDIRRINEEFASLQSPKVIVTTEKDATRLQDLEGLSDEVRKSLYVLPVKVSFMLEGEVSFNEKIIGYVLKNSRNSILAKGKDDHKSENSDSTGNRPRTISFRNNGQD